MSIYKKLFEAKKEIGKISKDSKNPFYKSKYFDINQLLEHVEPILQKHDLLLLQPIANGFVNSEIIDIESGESLVSGIELTNQTDPQKRGSEITYYRRYTLASLLGLQAEDDDANKTVTTNKPTDNKPWLNEKKGLDKTKEWQNIEVAIENGKITNIDQIEKVYKISKELKSKLELLIK